MCRWMGSQFHNYIDYNGVTFLVELLEWGRTFLGFPRKENSSKQGRLVEDLEDSQLKKWLLLLF